MGNEQVHDLHVRAFPDVPRRGIRALEIMEAVEREEGRPARSAWDMAQGITAVARRIPNTDDRLDMEIVAGRILTKVAA